ELRAQSNEADRLHETLDVLVETKDRQFGVVFVPVRLHSLEDGRHGRVSDAADMHRRLGPWHEGAVPPEKTRLEGDVAGEWKDGHGFSLTTVNRRSSWMRAT